MARINNALHVLHHLSNVARRPRLQRRRTHTQLAISPVKSTLMSSRPLPPRATIFCSLRQDLVINVGDIAHERDVKTLVLKPITHNIERHATTQMPNMRHRLHRRTTQIHRRMAGAQRFKIAELSGRRIINA